VKTNIKKRVLEGRKEEENPQYEKYVEKKTT